MPLLRQIGVLRCTTKEQGSQIPPTVRGCRAVAQLDATSRYLSAPRACRAAANVTERSETPKTDRCRKCPSPPQHVPSANAAVGDFKTIRLPWSTRPAKLGRTHTPPMSHSAAAHCLLSSTFLLRVEKTKGGACNEPSEQLQQFLPKRSKPAQKNSGDRLLDL